MTAFRPADHPWHRALWLSWKKINGINYWEEDRKTGLSQGRTEIVDVKINTNKDFSARIQMTLSYHPPEKAEVMTEKRVIIISAPDKDGSYHLDWASTTMAVEDVTLDRTPIPGQPGGVGYGGYAGFSIRMAKETRSWSFRNSEDLKEMALHGKNARWVDASGKTVSGKDAGVAIFSHSSNMRSPTPWYLSKQMPFVSPAIIFNEPMTLEKNESFTLKYRILIHPGLPDKDELDREWKEFSTE